MSSSSVENDREVRGRAEPKNGEGSEHHVVTASDLQPSKSNKTPKTLRKKSPLCFVTLFVPTLLSIMLICVVHFWTYHHHSCDSGAPSRYEVSTASSSLSSSSWMPVVAASVHVEDDKNDSKHPMSETGTSSTAESPSPRKQQSFFVHKSVIIPHDSKIHRGGEDAATTNSHLLVVADGVGGWARHGVNPGLFSRELTRRVVELFDRKKYEGSKEKNIGGGVQQKSTRPHEFLASIIHQANIETGQKHLGSATCTAVMLETDGAGDYDADNNIDVVGSNSSNSIRIHTVNVGDSGYSIHRKIKQDDDSISKGRKDSFSTSYEVVYASIPGQKSFNFPHQLGGLKHGDDVVDVATYGTHTLQPDDIIVVYSDGVSDNLFPHQYHPCFERYEVEQMSTGVQKSDTPALVSYSVVADCIARTAYKLGKDNMFDSPFAQGARAVGKMYRGGKHDDITVVVAQVVVAASTTGTETEVSSPPDNHSDGDKLEPDRREHHHQRQHHQKVQIMSEDPWRIESIFLYEDHPIGSVDDLPTAQDLQMMKKRVVVGDGDSSDDSDSDDGDSSSRSSGDEL